MSLCGDRQVGYGYDGVARCPSRLYRLGRDVVNTRARLGKLVDIKSEVVDFIAHSLKIDGLFGCETGRGSPGLAVQMRNKIILVQPPCQKFNAGNVGGLDIQRQIAVRRQNASSVSKHKGGSSCRGLDRYGTVLAECYIPVRCQGRRDMNRIAGFGGEFSRQYQFTIASVGLEALHRWRCPNLGQFLPAI